jgi:phage-related protein
VRSTCQLRRSLRDIRPLIWVASSKKDLLDCPEDVQQVFGYALHQAQESGKHEHAKSLKGFGSAGVLEVVEDDAAGTFRAVYTVKLETAVYVLHVFQKESKHGIATPQADINLIKQRLKAARELDRERREVAGQQKVKPP